MRKVDLRPKRCEKKKILYREMEKKMAMVREWKGITKKAIYMKIKTPNECQL